MQVATEVSLTPGLMPLISQLLDQHDFVSVEREPTKAERRAARQRQKERQPQHACDRAKALARSKRNTAAASRRRNRGK